MVLDLEIALLRQQHPVFRPPRRRRVQLQAGVVLEGRLDPPEVIEVPVRQHHEVDLAALEHPVDALAGEGVVHPVGVPAGIEQDLLLVAVEQGDGQQGRVAAGILPIPGDPVLRLLAAAVVGHVLLEAGVVEPAGLADHVDPEAGNLANIKSIVHRLPPLRLGGRHDAVAPRAPVGPREAPRREAVAERHLSDCRSAEAKGSDAGTSDPQGDACQARRRNSLIVSSTRSRNTLRN